MSHQSVARGVEAGGDLRAMLPQADEFEALLRDQIDRMAHACHVIPHPRESFNDCAPARNRPLSIKKFGMLIVALAQDPSLPSELLPAFANRLFAWVLSLQPVATGTLPMTWEAETRAQADADVAQARALRAIETRDLAAVEHAIDETTAHIAEAQRHLLRLTFARREIIAARRASVHALRS